MKANPNYLRWTLLRNVYPGDAGAQSDYLIGIAMKGAPSEPDPAMNDKVAQAAGMTYGDYMQQAH